MSRIASTALLLILAGCSVHSLDNGVFACMADSDCSAGEQCLEGICRSAASLDGGAPESGNCTESCASMHEMCCGTSCVNLATDNDNCGTCGQKCDRTKHESCYAGVCTKESSCSDDLDNNGDGLTDCQDTLACASGTACHNGGHCCMASCAFENDATSCSDGMDNDCNGLTDCADPGCAGKGCAEGSVCDSNMMCSPGCFIDGQFYSPDTPNMEASCLICDPTQSTSQWSPAQAGMASGTCQGTQACDGSGECRRASGQPCGGNGDCASKVCSPTACVTSLGDAVSCCQ